LGHLTTQGQLVNYQFFWAAPEQTKWPSTTCSYTEVLSISVSSEHLPPYKH